MSNIDIFGLSMVLSFVSYTLIARWYLIPWLQARPLEQALTPLLLLHSFRFVGLAFLLTGVTAAELPWAFAGSAAYGDLATAVLALTALAAIRFRSRAAMPTVWLFNVVGFADLLYALLQGRFISQVDPASLGATYFIPTLLVPALLLTHVVVFWLLFTRKSLTAGSTLASTY